MPKSIRVTGVSVAGTGQTGINLGTDRSSVVTASTVRVASVLGIQAGAVADSAALEIGGTNAIIAGSVANSIGTLTGAGTPISATDPNVPSISAQVTSVQSSANTIQTNVATLATAVDLVEPRTQIPGGLGNYTISVRGSYVLTGNRTVLAGDGIVITASDVVLDLNGFSISGTTASPAGGAGISIGGSVQNVTIRNGIIRGGTTYNGTAFSGNGLLDGISSLGGNVRVEGLIVTGIARSGIDLGISNGSSVRNCAVNVVGTDFGIQAELVEDSSAKTCGRVGIFAETAVNCAGESQLDLSGAGVDAAIVVNCRGRAASSFSVGVRGRTSVQHSVGYNSGSGLGIDAGGAIASYCRGTSIGGTGVQAHIAVSCLGSSGAGLGVVAPNRYNMP